MPSNPVERIACASGADDLANRSQLLVGLFAKQIEVLQLSEIRGEHSLVRDVETVLNRPPFPLPPSNCLPREVVMSLLECMPLLVTKEKDAIVCVGNIRLYRLANYALDPQELVPTRQPVATLTTDDFGNLKNSLLVEAFLLPAVFGRRTAEQRSLKSAWERAAKTKLLEFWPGVDSYAELCRETKVVRRRKRVHDRG